jgi:hypothetical protein
MLDSAAAELTLRLDFKVVQAPELAKAQRIPHDLGSQFADACFVPG